jgi:organic hydroperoxide reductase OsmC/OhrA
MLPETSSYFCTIHWQGDNVRDYDQFARLHEITWPGGQTLVSGAAHLIQNPRQTNPEELFASAVGSCMMATILAVFSKAQIPVTAYEDRVEAVLEFVERRFRVTKVFLRPQITLQGNFAEDKLKSLIEKSHANCFISLSVKSNVIVEPTFIQS